MAKFNYQAIAESIASSATGTRRVNTVMSRKFAENKEALLQDFDRHPVTVEIKGGISADNISDTLGGEGNLFSFIGFDDGSDPIQPLRDALQDGVVLIHSKRGEASGNKIRYKFSARIPAEEIRLATPLPWENGNSWVEGVEKRGISGLGQFLYRKFRSPKPSRSGGGIQTATTLRQATFKRRAYISELIRNFVQRFTR